MAYGNTVGAETLNAPREPLASIADSLNREAAMLAERLMKISDRLNGSTPRPADPIQQGKPDGTPPVNLSMSRLVQGLQRCHNVLNEIEGIIG